MCVDDTATYLFLNRVNQNLDVCDLCLGWGRLNSVMVNEIHSCRFTSTDGFKNQKYGNVEWIVQHIHLVMIMTTNDLNYL